MTIGDRIINELNIKGRTQADLARHLGTKPSTVAGWIKLNRSPSADTIAPICEFLDITTDYLLKGESINQQVTTGNISNTGALGIHNNAPVTISNGIERELSKQEQDLLRIYNAVDGKKQMEIMKFVYNVEE